MAFVESRNGKYRVVFRYGGRRYTKSLKTISARAANSSLARLDDNLRRLELGTLQLPPDVDLPTFLLSDGQKVQKTRHIGPRTLGQLLDEFLQQIPEHSIEYSTRQSFEIHIKHLKRVLGASLQIHGIELVDIQRYVNSRAADKGIRGRNLSPATIKKEIVTLNTAWRWAVNNRFIDRPLPKNGLRYPKGIEKPPFQTWQEIERIIARGGLAEGQEQDLWDCLFLTTEDVGALLTYVSETARHEFLYPMFAFAAHTGARRSEMLRSEVADLDFDSNQVTIREKKRVHGKLTTRKVPMSAFLRQVLADWLEKHPGGQKTFCMYPHENRLVGQTALNKHKAHNHFVKTLDGSRWQVLRGWHVFRHSFCSNCAAASVPQPTINEWVGHQTEEMVRRYRHLLPKQQAAEISKVFGNQVVLGD